LETHVLFFVAAGVAGLINSLAGGGGLITFPLLALVVPPVVADATSALALFPAYPSAVWRTRSKLREVRRLWLWLLLVTSALGGLVGALLLVWTGERNLLFLVPWLVLGGTVLFVLEPRLSRPSVGAHQDSGPCYGAVAARGGRGVRSGHLRQLLRGRYRHLDDQCPESAADVRCAPRGALQEFARWVPQGRGCGRARDLRGDRLGYGIPMAVGGLIGGYLGGALTGRINRTFLRAVVTIIGFGLAAYYFRTLYAPPGLHFGGE
jgi:uncharacterized protein